MSTARHVLPLALVTLVVTGAWAATPPDFSPEHGDSITGDYRLMTFANRADPTAWTLDDATGQQFRRATMEELRVNDWPIGSFLVEVEGLERARAGEFAPLSFLVPRDDDVALRVELTHAATSVRGPFAETAVDGDTRTYDATFHDFVGVLPSDDPSTATAVGVRASEEGGVAGYGVDALRQVEIRGRESSWVISQLGAVPDDLVLVTLYEGTPRDACGFTVVAPVDLCAPSPEDGGRLNACDIPVGGKRTCDTLQAPCPSPGMCATICGPNAIVVSQCEPGLGLCVEEDVGVRVSFCGSNSGQNRVVGCGIHPLDYQPCGFVDCPAAFPYCEPVCIVNPSVRQLVCDAAVPCAAATLFIKFEVCEEASSDPACSDGIDNDGDGRTDYPSDPGCSSATDDDERDSTGGGAACNDGIDNDGDGWVDYPQDPGCTTQFDTTEADARTQYTFAMMGEIQWCTAYSGNWESRLTIAGNQIEQSHDANGATRADLFHTFSHCWTAGSQSAAQQCDRNGGCTDGSGHNYPYNACDRLGPCYRDRVWSDVTHSRQHSSFGGVHAAQALHLTTTLNADGDGLCGIASFPGSSSYYGTSSGPLPSGDSMGTDSLSNCRNYVMAHEMGHVFNAIHEKGDCNEGGRPGVMLYADNRGNFFCDANRLEVNRCNDDFNYCPRSGTG